MVKFPQRLNGMMQENSCTQQKLADLLSVKRQTIGKYTNGSTEPSLETLNILANFFGVSVDYLIGREDDFGNITIRSDCQQLSESERDLLETFRRMPEKLQKIAVNNLHSFAGDDEKR